MGLCAASGALSGLHNALALAGLLPAFGIIPDLADGLLYLLEGDLANAGIAGLAALPMLGQGVRAAALARKAAKFGDAFDVARKASRYGDEVADAAIHASPPCFVAGTLIHTSDGLKPIEEIETDDTVLSRDEETGAVDYKRVTRRFVTPDQPVIELSLEDEEGGIETLGTTAEHPFWVKARGWIGAGELLPGDEVFTSTGGWLKVTGSTWLSGRQTVYNLEVEGYHTYFVGNVGAWVHNMCHVPASKNPVAGKITGYTKHGLNQAVGRNGGRGVNAKAMLEAVRNPKKVVEQANGATKYVGKKATVILNQEGKVVTTYGKSRGPQIWNQGTTRPSGSGSAQRRANEQGFSYLPGAVR